jgi:mono/diheme cytochrome c family protein
MERGRRIFNNLCIACHGQYGLGDGRVPPRGLPPPPSLLDRRERDFSDARIFHIITSGQNVMPSYAWQLPPADRWAVVHYVRALQRAFPEPPPAAPAGPLPAGEAAK